MIKIDDFSIVTSECSSKGNQHKFYNNGYWVKLDNERCFEGLAEEFVSRFESLILDFPYVEYKTDLFSLNGDEYKGCYCYSMYNDVNVVFYSLRHIFRSNNIPLNIFIKEEDTAKNIQNVIMTIFTLTGVDITSYIFRLLFLDALIINEDRHYMNLGVCCKGNQYAQSACFDNGASLFCTNWTYRKTKSLEENIASAMSVARPFSKFFDKQVDACIRLGAKPLQIYKKGLDLLMISYHNPLYDDKMNNLVKAVLSDRLAYYYNKGVYEFV